MPAMSPGSGSTTGRSGIRDRSPSCFRCSACSSFSLWCVDFSGAAGALVAAARGRAESHRCSRSGIAGNTSPRRQATPSADIGAGQPSAYLAATIEDEGLADAVATSPFRLPRLHPGISARNGGQRALSAMIVIVSWADGTTPPVNLARVVVVGTSCSGKTTFAHQLASKLNIECVELDALYWGPGWTPRPTFEGDVLAAVQQARWVIDGNYSRVRDIIWRHATAIAWLDYSFARVFSQAVRRTLRRVVLGERLYGGNRETIRETLFDVEAPLWLVVRTHGRRRREFPELFERAEYRHVGIIQLQTPIAAKTFLAKASTRAESD